MRETRLVKLGILALVLLLIESCTQATAAQQNADLTRNLIATLLANGKIARVSIIHVPGSIETRTRINQKALRNLSQIEISFVDLTSESFREGLRESLEELSTAKASAEHEVRWGVLFLDHDGKEQAALFFDQTGRFLQVRDERYTVDGKLLAWLISQIRESLK